MVILGISLGTTTVGIAVISERELVMHNTHSFRDVWSENKAEAILAKLLEYIRRYRVQVVIVKLPPESHQPATVTHLFHRLAEICAYHGCTVQEGTAEAATARRQQHFRSHAPRSPELPAARAAVRAVAKAQEPVPQANIRGRNRRTSLQSKRPVGPFLSVLVARSISSCQRLA